MEKVKSISIIVMSIMLIMLSAILCIQLNSIKEQSSQLTAFDGEIQRLNTNLGISESKLLKESELNLKYKDELSKLSEEFNDKLKEHNLRLQSRDETIAILKTKLRGGITKVVISDPKTTPEESGAIEKQSISYEWKNSDGRFKLVDPDIFIENNEEFYAEQQVRVRGYVFYGKDGKLQIRKMELSEVAPDGLDEKGKVKYKKIKSATIKLVDSSFEYINNLPADEKKLLDIFKIRALASYDSHLTPGLGVELLNIGRFVDYANVGLNAKISSDLSDPLNGSLNKSRVGIGINYQLIPPIINTNLAIGIGVSTPLDNFGGKFIVTADLIYYLTN